MAEGRSLQRFLQTFFSCSISSLYAGVAHFYDAFSTNHELDIRIDALRAFELPEAAINPDLSVVVPWTNQILPAAGPVRKVPAEEDDTDSVVSVASSNTQVAKPDGDTDSDASAASEENTTTEVVDLVTEDESDEESEEDFELSEKEQRFLQEAHDVHTNTGDAWVQQRATSTPGCRTPFANAGNVQTTFENLAELPDGWPLMRILIPLDGLSLQIERIVTCVAAESAATHRSPNADQIRKESSEEARCSSCLLANEVASIVAPVATVDNKEMVAPMHRPPLTPAYWVRPIYTELLHSSSRLRKDTRIETARPSNKLCAPLRPKARHLPMPLHTTKDMCTGWDLFAMFNLCMCGCRHIGHQRYAKSSKAVPTGWMPRESKSSRQPELGDKKQTSRLSETVLSTIPLW